jgi:hypothetical protein
MSLLVPLIMMMAVDLAVTSGKEMVKEGEQAICTWLSKKGRRRKQENGKVGAQMCSSSSSHV